MGDVPTGMMLERFGRKPVMVVGTISLSLATLGLVFLQHFPALVALRFLAGVGTAMWNISRMAYLADTVPIRDRGRALSTFGGVSRIGTFMGPALGPGGHAAGPRRPVLCLRHRVGSGGLISILFISESRPVTVPRGTTRAGPRWGGWCATTGGSWGRPGRPRSSPR